MFIVVERQTHRLEQKLPRCEGSDRLNMRRGAKSLLFLVKSHVTTWSVLASVETFAVDDTSLLQMTFSAAC